MLRRVPELVAQLQVVKHQHQEYFTPAFELLLRRMSLQDTNSADENCHFSLNTPPFEGFDAQPIEKAWAHSKNYVALTPEAHTQMISNACFEKDVTESKRR
jgi:hypothetical protein